MEVLHGCVGDHGVLRAVLRTSVARREGPKAADDDLRSVESRRHVGHAVHRGVSIDLWGRRFAAVRHLGAWVLAALWWSLGRVLREVHGRLPAHSRDAVDVALPRRGSGA